MRYQPRGPRRVLGFLLVIAAFAAAGGAVVMVLWNAVLPKVVTVQTLTYPQALGLLALCRILFGGFGGRGSGRPWGGHRGAHWRDKWKGMSDEERMRFREEWKARCAARTRGVSAHQSRMDDAPDMRRVDDDKRPDY